MTNPSPRLITLLLAAALLAACGPSPEAAAATSQALAATIIAETVAAMPTDTATATTTHTPTATETLTPSYTPTPSDTPSATAYAGPLEGAMLMYFIPLDDEGEPAGCGDKLVAVNTGILPTGDAATDAAAALARLFGVRQQYLIGLYNPLYGSNINIDSAGYEAAYDEVVINTSGNISRGDDKCNWDRIRAMVRATLRNASPEQSVEVRFNGHAFNDIVSGDH